MNSPRPHITVRKLRLGDERDRAVLIRNGRALDRPRDLADLEDLGA